VRQLPWQIAWHTARGLIGRFWAATLQSCSTESCHRIRDSKVPVRGQGCAGQQLEHLVHALRCGTQTGTKVLAYYLMDQKRLSRRRHGISRLWIRRPAQGHDHGDGICAFYCREKMRYKLRFSKIPPARPFDNPGPRGSSKSFWAPAADSVMVRTL
jgi:hypothetical protein